MIVTLLIIVLIIVGIILYLCLFTRNEKNRKQTNSNLMINLVNKNVSEVEKLKSKYHLTINITYEYSDTIPKDNIISQSIKEKTKINKNDTLDIVVSLGKLDKEKLAADKIDEMGHIPIMMYHGIVNKPSSETGNTGGNVDKDGYQRTAEAFRKDLEFYYENNYRFIRLNDYIDGHITTEYGKSPIVLTFDDGLENNIKVTGLDSNGNIIIDPNSAIGILEQFKKDHPDAGVTATFFVNGGIFEQSEYNDKILKWLVTNGYDVGNHTESHLDIKDASQDRVQKEIAFVYDELDKVIPGKYVNIIALPFGSPYVKSHANFPYVLNATYNGKEYATKAALRVGWEAELSPYDKAFDPTFLKRCRAYDNNGKEFDIEMNFKLLEKNRYVSDGNQDTIVTSKDNEEQVNASTKKTIFY